MYCSSIESRYTPGSDLFVPFLLLEPFFVTRIGETECKSHALKGWLPPVFQLCPAPIGATCTTRSILAGQSDFTTRLIERRRSQVNVSILKGEKTNHMEKVDHSP